MMRSSCIVVQLPSSVHVDTPTNDKGRLTPDTLLFIPYAHPTFSSGESYDWDKKKKSRNYGDGLALQNSKEVLSFVIFSNQLSRSCSGKITPTISILQIPKNQSPTRQNCKFRTIGYIDGYENHRNKTHCLRRVSVYILYISKLL